jgi:integrase
VRRGGAYGLARMDSVRRRASRGGDLRVDRAAHPDRARAGSSASVPSRGLAVRQHVVAVNLGKAGACHLCRHTMATLMHEGSADIRFIQAILGHEDLKTTQIYTQVAIRTLKQIHAATHPAAMLDKSNAPSLPTKSAQHGIRTRGRVPGRG